jgi:hypothetical protein
VTLPPLPPPSTSSSTSSTSESRSGTSSRLSMMSALIMNDTVSHSSLAQFEADLEASQSYSHGSISDGTAGASSTAFFTSGGYGLGLQMSSSASLDDLLFKSSSSPGGAMHTIKLQPDSTQPIPGRHTAFRPSELHPVYASNQLTSAYASVTSLPPGLSPPGLVPAGMKSTSASPSNVVPGGGNGQAGKSKRSIFDFEDIYLSDTPSNQDLNSRGSSVSSVLSSLLAQPTVSAPQYIPPPPVTTSLYASLSSQTAHTKTVLTTASVDKVRSRGGSESGSVMSSDSTSTSSSINGTSNSLVSASNTASYSSSTSSSSSSGGSVSTNSYKTFKSGFRVRL